MKLYLRTFGCQMNVHDSSRILEILGRSSYELTEDPRQADLIVINTCSVREKAWHKAVSEAGRMCLIKKKNPGLVIAVVGCVAQQQGQKWFAQMPLLDLVVGPDHYGDLAEYVDRVRLERTPRAIVGFDEGLESDFLTTRVPGARSEVSAFVTVMKGCSERCHYCIVPTVRGPERFRRADDIVSEVERLVKNGTKEIVLLGQKVNVYSEGQLSFAGLLQRLDRISGLERIRFTSPHPRHMSDELIACFGTLRTLCESIHLPVQSGSDRTLERMGRRYTADFYREVTNKLRAACPEIMISTDFIVGYPGETEADFEETIRLIEDVRFAGVFSFKYSPRPHTVAAELTDDVPSEEKARRLARLHDVIGKVECEIKTELVGTHHEVLVEGKGRNPGQLTGRARNSQIINFISTSGAKLSSDSDAGQLVAVQVVRVLPHSLEGKPL
jgi:tRNA-2-methylthio-N6-dimethylallyladenosine synthase